MKADDCLRELQALRERYGYGNFDHALRKLKAQRFNHRSNLQLLHPRCNLEKSSKSIGEQSKATGKPFTELIG